MKKLISIILLCATAVLLCACGSAAPDKSSSGGSAVPPMQTASGSDTQAAADAPEEKAAENEQKIIAESYIGKEVSELYDAMRRAGVGQLRFQLPWQRRGRRGLVYNGFTVYTYKEGDSEVVQNVQ